MLLKIVVNCMYGFSYGINNPNRDGDRIIFIPADRYKDVMETGMGSNTRMNNPHWQPDRCALTRNWDYAMDNPHCQPDPVQNAHAPSWAGPWKASGPR